MSITVDELWKSVGGDSQPKVSVASTLQTSKHLLTVCFSIIGIRYIILQRKFAPMHTQMRTLHEKAEASN